MCIIVIQPEGHSFDDAAIFDFYDHNPHGFGFMWHAAGKVHGARTVPRDADDAIALYRKYADGVPGVMHFRWATSGPVNASMAHPFAVSGDLLVMHNGVFGGLGCATESDTAEFVRTVLVPLLGKDYRRLQDPKVQEILTERSRGSALVFMDKTGEITQFGHVGVEYDGCWYSNTYAWTVPFGDDDEFDEPEECVSCGEWDGHAQWCPSTPAVR